MIEKYLKLIFFIQIFFSKFKNNFIHVFHSVHLLSLYIRDNTYIQFQKVDSPDRE